MLLRVAVTPAWSRGDACEAAVKLHDYHVLVEEQARLIAELRGALQNMTGAGVCVCVCVCVCVRACVCVWRCMEHDEFLKINWTNGYVQ